MPKKKEGGSSRDGRDSNSKRRTVGGSRRDGKDSNAERGGFEGKRDARLHHHKLAFHHARDDHEGAEGDNGE